MKDKMVLELLIKAIIYGRIRYDHPYILEANNIPTIQTILETIAKQNLEDQNYFSFEKNNLLAILGLYRFDYPFQSKKEEYEMKNWCNMMIGLFNRADSQMGTINKIELYENHGYELDEENIDQQMYERISEQVGAMSELEFYLMDYLRTEGVASAEWFKQFMIEPEIESCIYYLLQVYQGKFSRSELLFFLTIEEARKMLSSIELENKQCYIIKESTQNSTIGTFNLEEMKLIQQSVNLNFSNLLENVIQSDLFELEQKTKKKL